MTDVLKTGKLDIDMCRDKITCRLREKTALYQTR
jgi:hypothetical protein